MRAGRGLEMDRAAGVAAVAAGMVAIVAALCWHGAIGGAEIFPFALRTEPLYATALSLMAVALAILGRLVRLGRTASWLVAIGVMGGVIGGGGEVVMMCAPGVRAALARIALDCGPAGAILSLVGRVALHFGVAAVGVTVFRRQTLQRASVLPLFIVLAGAMVWPATEIGGVIAGDSGARLGHLAASVPAAAGWLLLGVLLLGPSRPAARRAR